MTKYARGENRATMNYRFKSLRGITLLAEHLPDRRRSPRLSLGQRTIALQEQITATQKVHDSYYCAASMINTRYNRFKTLPNAPSPAGR